MDRIVVIGSSGSGKTTVARRLAAALHFPFLEMDSVFHRGGWAQTPPAEFRETLADFTAAQHWVVDGNYTSHGVREVVWPRADTVVWLDPRRHVVMTRVILRTLRRLITREELWDGLREPWTNLHSRDPEKNIVVWTWTQFHHVREKYEAALIDGDWDHATVHRLREPAEV